MKTHFGAESCEQADLVGATVQSLIGTRAAAWGAGQIGWTGGIKWHQYCRALWKFKKGLAGRATGNGSWSNLSGFLNLGSLKTNLKEIQSIGNSLRNNNNEGNLNMNLGGNDWGYWGEEEAKEAKKFV